MSFSENLQTLRKSAGISQEQLAERLDVSRQAVSKWETDGGYPEMDKIVQLCGIFNCTMDELVTGKVSVDKPADRKLYDDHFNRFSKGIALGVTLIILGVAIIVFICAIGDMNGSELLTDGIAPATIIMFVAVATAMFIIVGVEHEGFRKSHQTMPELYTPEEKERFNKKFAIAIATAVALILIAITPVIVIDTFVSEGDMITDLIALPIFLVVLALSVGTIIYWGIQYSKYDIEGYNLENIKEFGTRSSDSDAPLAENPARRENITDKVCGVIMLTATLVFVAIGLMTNEWHPTWVVFPIGGILCAIVNVIFGD